MELAGPGSTRGWKTTLAEMDQLVAIPSPSKHPGDRHYEVVAPEVDSHSGPGSSGEIGFPWAEWREQTRSHLEMLMVTYP